MSKRTRHQDNSKRQQPVQQQRAQARQPAGGAPAGKAGSSPPQRQGEAGGNSGR